jgi:hypothetical protein
MRHDVQGRMEAALRDIAVLGGDVHCAEILQREISKLEHIPGWLVKAVRLIRRGMGDAHLALRIESFFLETKN